MRFLNRPGRWAIPAALAAALVAALVISPAVGGPNFVSPKKLKKTISKKTNAIQLVSAGTTPVGAAEQLIATLELRPGNWIVRSTFTLERPAGAQSRCLLRIAGVGQDQMVSSQGGGAPDAEDPVAMEVAGSPEAVTQAQLLCASPLPATVRHVEITALKVPKLTVISG